MSVPHWWRYTTIKSTENDRASKFTYSPLGKAFEKQIKTIEDQWEKQIDALENLKDTNKQIVSIDNDQDKLLLSNKREIFSNIYNKRLNKIEDLTKKNWW